MRIRRGAQSCARPSTAGDADCPGRSPNPKLRSLFPAYLQAIRVDLAATDELFADGRPLGSSSGSLPGRLAAAD